MLFPSACSHFSFAFRARPDSSSKSTALGPYASSKISGGAHHPAKPSLPAGMDHPLCQYSSLGTPSHHSPHFALPLVAAHSTFHLDCLPLPLSCSVFTCPSPTPFRGHPVEPTLIAPVSSECPLYFMREIFTIF